jgi:hypothetical protein
MKRTYSTLTLPEAMQMIPADRILSWNIDAPPRAPSATIQEYLRRLRVFDLTTTDVAKLLLIDALFIEVVPAHAHLKVWKAMPLETDALTGIADYIFSPDYAYLKTPLLCVTEAKRDAFVQGEAQCIAEMVACQWKNRVDDYAIDIYGIVSNGTTWKFYRLTLQGEVYATNYFSLSNLPELLGILHFVCAERAKAIPVDN